MELYKITICPVNSFCSPLQSDTFFGAFCWSYLHLYGEEKLKKLIQNYKTANPEIIFSNAFFKGFLPAPFSGIIKTGDENASLSKQEKYQKYIEKKKAENLAYLPLEKFNLTINGEYDKIPSNCQEPMEEQKVMVWRNLVGRETGTVGSVDSGESLFEMEETFYSGEYDVYLYSSLDVKVLEETLEEMFFSGIGAKRSVGKGAFRITKRLEVFQEFQIPAEPNGFLALSNFIPGKEDPTEGYYQAFVKYPKLSESSSEGDSPFKKPLIFLNAGSVFYDNPVRNYYGSCIERIALKENKISDQIIVGAYTIAIPCILPKELGLN